MAGYSRNQYSYVDPGDVGGPPAPFGMTDPPPYDPATEMREGSWGWEGLPKETLKALFPELMRGARPPLESAILDAGQFLPTPERGALLAKEAIGPMAAGMIKMGGKEFPNAYALRTLEDNEIPWLKRLLRSEKPHDVSTTVVSPAQVGSWGDAGNQYGLMFDVLDPKAVKAISPSDLHAGFSPLDNAVHGRQELASINPSHSEAKNFTDKNLPQSVGGSGEFSWPSQQKELNDFDLNQFIKDNSNIYNEAVLSLGKDTPIAGVRIVPKQSSFYNPNKELDLVSYARSLGVPIFNIPGSDQIAGQAPRLMELNRKHGAGGSWVKGKGEYKGTKDIEKRSKFWKDLYED